MKKRTVVLVLALLLLFVGAGVLVRPRPAAPPYHDPAAVETPQAKLDPREAMREELAKTLPGERDRREMELLAPYAKDALVGPRDWDGKTDGLFPEQFPEPESRGERPKAALWHGPGDVAPDGTISESPKTAPRENLAETTSTVAPEVKPAYQKPPDPDEGPRRPAQKK